MKLVEQHIIKQSSAYYNELHNLLYKCKNLYNKGLYVIRQYYFQHKDDNTVKYKYLNYYSLGLLKNLILQNVASWIMRRFVNMNPIKEEESNEDCLKPLLVR